MDFKTHSNRLSRNHKKQSFIDNHGQHFIIGFIGGFAAYQLDVTDKPVRFGIYVGLMDFARKHVIEKKAIY